MAVPTLEEMMLHVCSDCYSETYLAIRPKSFGRKGTLKKNGPVFELVRYVDLGKGLPTDLTEWNVLTTSATLAADAQIKESLRQLWLNVLPDADSDATEELSNEANSPYSKYSRHSRNRYLVPCT
jgi:hypothetical protein